MKPDLVVPQCDCVTTCSTRATLHVPGCPRMAALLEKYGAKQ